jgi:hypothetical protein
MRNEFEPDTGPLDSGEIKGELKTHLLEALRSSRYYAWITKKKAQVRIRKSLSKWFALALAVLALIREFPELKLMYQSHHIGILDGLVLVIICATVAALAWEHWGNKLTTSPQEVRFVAAMHSLLQRLEKFMYGLDRIQDPTERLQDFIAFFLDVTAGTLCGRKVVDSGLMLETPDKSDVGLFQSSRGAKYPPTLKIPIQRSDTGPAGVSYQRKKIIYVPYKKREIGWIFEYRNNRYRAKSPPHKGWIRMKKEFERFRSVLCLPVAIYQKTLTKSSETDVTEPSQEATQQAGSLQSTVSSEETQVEKKPFGVLNYSTNSRDPFVDRDFQMGECFSSILALVLETYRQEQTPPTTASAATPKAVTP